MEFRTIVDIPKPDFQIGPCEEILFVGSCFADSIGQRFKDEGFPVVVNPFGTMYNPVSVLHTIERLMSGMDFPRTVFLTLGTNHVYRLKETGEIVDNCQKRPAAIFQEEELSVEQCAESLQQTVNILREKNPDVRIVFTVSPIRYRKYGYHKSQLSKATLLLAVDKLVSGNHCSRLAYFPSYEILNDELRDYRFYATDMLHPSSQAVDYIWERLVDSLFSAEAKAFLEEWKPLKKVLSHRPFSPESAAYRELMDKTMLEVEKIREKYPAFDFIGVMGNQK